MHPASTGPGPRLMIKSEPAEVLVGLSLGLTLLTTSRFMEGVGVGELGLASFSICAIAAALARSRLRLQGMQGRMAATFLAYVTVVLLPLTAINLYFHTAGSSFRDWGAYALCAAFILACAVRELRVEMVVKWLIIALCVNLVFQYFFGGGSAWYYGRFSAGAKNPNQLALYMACAIVLAAGALHRPVLRALVVCFLGAVAVATGSDAVMAFGATAGVVYLVSSILPARVLPIFAPPLLGLVIWIWFAYGADIVSIGQFEWSQADQGDSRLLLYANGLRAWLDSPFSIVVGHGAGVYSGLGAPFSGSESHNTPIDILTIGGVVGLVVLYFHFLKGLATAYRAQDTLLVASFSALLVFSLFHFVARQPIYWFCLYSCLGRLRR